MHFVSVKAMSRKNTLISFTYSVVVQLTDNSNVLLVSLVKIMEFITEMLVPS